MGAVWFSSLRLATVLAVLLGMLAGPLLTSRPAGAQGVGPYDLAATIMPPEALGIPDEGEAFGLVGSGPLSVERVVTFEFGSDAVGTAVQDDLEATGWLGSQLHEYHVFADDERTELATGYQFLVHQFGDDEGAEAAFDAFDADYEPLETTLDLGDGTRMVEVTVPAGGPVAEESTALKLSVLDGDVVATIRIGHVATGEAATDEEFEPLAELFLERIEAVRDGEGPGLGALVQGVELEGAQPPSGYYRRLDGEPIRRAEQTEEDIIGFVGEDTVHVYTSQVIGPNPDTVMGGEVAYAVDLYVLPDEDTAAAFLGDAEDFIANQLRVEGVEPIDSGGAIGDGSVAFEVSSTSAQGRPFLATAVLTQVEERVAQVRLLALGAEGVFPVETVEVLAEAQADCLDAGECPDAIDLAEVLAGDGGSDDDEGTAAGDEDGAGGEQEVYESPQYGYTVAYDPAEWAISAEDDDPGDTYDRVQLEHELGVVTLVGDPDYRTTQLDDCVADYAGGLEQAEGVDNVEPIEDEAGEDDDRAWAAFAYELEGSDGEPVAAVRYIECRTLGEVTVVVAQSSLEEDYDAFSAEREELLEGLEAA